MDALQLGMGILAGMVGTLVMDQTNRLLSRWRLIGSVNPLLLGRLSQGWLKGRFLYDSPAGVPPVSSEWIKGTVTHYLIGAVLGVFYIGIAHLLALPGSSLLFAVTYGAATSIFAWWMLFPSIGLGWFGLKSPPEMPMFRTSLVNHLNYGVGLGLFFLGKEWLVRLL